MPLTLDSPSRTLDFYPYMCRWAGDIRLGELKSGVQWLYEWLSRWMNYKSKPADNGLYEAVWTRDFTKMHHFQGLVNRRICHAAHAKIHDIRRNRRIFHGDVPFWSIFGWFWPKNRRSNPGKKQTYSKWTLLVVSHIQNFSFQLFAAVCFFKKCNVY